MKTYSKMHSKHMSATINDKEFHAYDEISFTVWNRKTNHFDRVIGRIVYIGDSNIIIDRVEINRLMSDPEKEYEYIYRDISDANYVA